MPEFVGWYRGFEWLFIVYFLVLNSAYLVLCVTAGYLSYRLSRDRSEDVIDDLLTRYFPPVTVVVPCYNESSTIMETVDSIRSLDYPSVELIVVNDGSTDETLPRLKEALRLESTEQIYRDSLETKPIVNVYRSKKNPNVRVVDKENGGKSDALNTGFNLAGTPYVCTIDADSILAENGLKILVHSFLTDSNTVAAGGTIRVANGSHFEDGLMDDPRLPEKVLPLLQVIEYLRAFLFGRLGWDALNAVPIVSGAFAMFDRSAVMDAGGFRRDNVAEDMEMILRLHRLNLQADRDYRIRFVPDPICWTQVPADIESLRIQRIRWQQGVFESLDQNRDLLLNMKGKALGWLSLPFLGLLLGVGSILEVLGFVYMGTAYAVGILEPGIALLFLGVAIGYGVIISLVAFLVEGLTFNIYDSPGDFVKMTAAVLFENLGYRQVNSLWRFYGMIRWLVGVQGRPSGKILRTSFMDSRNHRVKETKDE